MLLYAAVAIGSARVYYSIESDANSRQNLGLAAIGGNVADGLPAGRRWGNRSMERETFGWQLMGELAISQCTNQQLSASAFI